MTTRKIDIGNSTILDFIRGASAQLVVIGHLLSFYGVMQEYNIPRIQNFGVMIFFVLSGFLITQTTILKHKEYGFKNYIIDRFSRIYTAFLPALALVLITDYFLKEYGVYNLKYDDSIKTFVGNVFMLQAHPVFRLLDIQTFGSARPFWTVSVEWFIYILFGLLFYFSLKKIVGNLVLLFLFGLAFLMAFFYLGGSQQGLTYYWFLGFVSTYLYNDNRIKITNPWVYVGLLLLLTSGIIYRTYILKIIEMYDIGLAISFTLIFLLLLNPPDQFKSMFANAKFHNFSKWLASYSYSLYLIHYTYIEVFKQFLSVDNIYLDMTIIFFLVNIVSFIFYLVFEQRHSIVRKKLKKMYL